MLKKNATPSGCPESVALLIVRERGNPSFSQSHDRTNGAQSLANPGAA